MEVTLKTKPKHIIQEYDPVLRNDPRQQVKLGVAY